MKELVSGLEVVQNFDLKDEVFAAHTANQKVESDVPFREAYSEVKEEQNYVKNEVVKEPKNQSFEGLEGFWQSEKESFQEFKASLLGNSFEA
jgi:argininosuccinate lyase